MRISVEPLRRWWQTVPRLIRFLLVNCAIGVAGGWTLLAALLATDTAHLRTLILNEASPAIPILLLAAGFAITFGSAAMGAAVMAMRPGDEDDK
ncbi:MAG: hypothetical protein ACLQKK_05145 [Rhodomicrobium sp.]